MISFNNFCREKFLRRRWKFPPTILHLRNREQIRIWILSFFLSLSLFWTKDDVQISGTRSNDRCFHHARNLRVGAASGRKFSLRCLPLFRHCSAPRSPRSHKFLYNGGDQSRLEVDDSFTSCCQTLEFDRLLSILIN